MFSIKSFLTKNTLICSVIYLVFSVSIAQSQIFQLPNREYRFLDGKWYNYFNGQKGDELILRRLIVRLKNHGDLRKFNFNSINLPTPDFVYGPLFGGYYVIDISSQNDPFQVVTAISSSILFDYVEFDVLGEYQGNPNDPLFQNQWNLTKISAPSAWNIATGNQSIILAILDCGTDYNHEDLSGNIWVNPSEDRNGNGIPDFTPYSQGGDLDGVDNDSNGYIDDLIGWDFCNRDNIPFDGVSYHGTAVAGIAGALTNNNMGISGIAGGWGASKGVRLMILQNYISETGVDYALSADAVRYAAKNGARVINMSFIVSGDFPYFHNAIDSAEIYYNCVLVGSAGNSASAINYPAKYSNVIAVGATLQNDSRWVEVEGKIGSCIGPELDVMAPGGEGNIYTTDVSGVGGASSGNYYYYFGGTSASAPHVSGLAALILSINPSLTYSSVRSIICSTTDKVAGMNGQSFTQQYGYGRINAYKALLNVASPVIISPAGNEKWCYNTSHTISWTTSVSSTFEIRLSTDGGQSFPTQVASSVGSPYSYNWTVNGSPSSNCKILVINNNNNVLRDTSNVFSIQANPPATPTNFNVVIYQNKPKLTWTAVPNVAGYNFWRASSEEGYYWGVGPFDWITDPSATSYIDTEVYHNPNNRNLNVMKYKMESFSSCGGVSPQTPEKSVSYERMLVKDALSNDIPTEFRLKQNYPNPFNPSTTIRLALPQAGKVKLEIYNAIGQSVRTLVNEYISEGYYDAVWNGLNDAGNQISSGVYFYRLEITNENKVLFQDLQKMILLK